MPPISHEDMKLLKEELDSRYVLQTDCNDIQIENQKKFSNDDTRLKILIDKQDTALKQQKFNNWLTIAILGTLVSTIVGAVIKYIITL